MSLPSRTGSSAGRTAAGTLVGLSRLAIALIPRLALAQMTDMEKVQGSSWNAKTREDAEREALEHCRATAGDSPCTLEVTVADVCVSLVMDTREHVVTPGGPTGASNFADSAATLRCQRRTTYSNGNPIFTPGQASTAPPGRR